MSPELIFDVATYSAMAGWLLLVAYPFVTKLANTISGFVLPVIYSIGYALIVLIVWGPAEGGFGGLDNVMLLFSQKWPVVAVWLHFLPFDMIIGTWQCRTAQAEGIPHWMVVPCLVLTFLFGPVGFLMFIALRYFKGDRAAVTKIL